MLEDNNILHTLEPAYHPTKKLAFLLDWLVTLKCNFDCDYCSIGMFGHDNSTAHPPMDDCLKMLKQSYEYVDCYVQQKKSAFRNVHLNIYGGEALYHPNIETLMEESSKLFQPYAGRWTINRRLTTNASATLNKWKNVTDHLEGVTFSYHPQGPKKLKDNFVNNVEYFITTKKDYDIVVLMYPREPFFTDSLNFLNLCIQKQFKVRPRLIDGPLGVYNKDQLELLKLFFEDKNGDNSTFDNLVIGKDILSQGRACCGGRQMCLNRDLKNSVKFVKRDQSFEGWYCSANQFFLMMNSFTKEFYTNKDCHVRLDQTSGPLATIDTMDAYIDQLKTNLEQNQPHFLKCVQQRCRCGTCAPKSKDIQTLESIMKIYNVEKEPKL